MRKQTKLLDANEVSVKIDMWKFSRIKALIDKNEWLQIFKKGGGKNMKGKSDFSGSVY